MTAAVTFWHHSCFSVETEETGFLFDWYMGDYPAFQRGKPVFVFASHAHSDHYSEEIFRMFSSERKTEFFLSSDICPPVGAECRSVGPHERISIPGGSVETLASTDAGVAFVVTYGGVRILHMGDLNWWDWGMEDTPEESQAMAEAYCREIALLAGNPVDIAMVPVDPRLGDRAFRGIDALMHTVDIRNVFPMHCWGDKTIIDTLLHRPCSEPYRERIRKPVRQGQTWLLRL